LDADPNCIQSGETADDLTLDAGELNVTRTTPKSLLENLGHEEGDVREIVRDVLAKLPDEHSIRAIDLDRRR